MRIHRVVDRACKVILCALLGTLLQPVLFATAASTQAPASARNAATPTPIVIPRQNFEYVRRTLIRPRDARRMHIAVGIFEKYNGFAIVGLLPIMEITIRDRKTGAANDYALAFGTTLNGRPLKCTPEKIIVNQRFCAALPSEFVPGKTIIALLYWRRAFADFPLLRGTDTIVTLQP